MTTRLQEINARIDLACKAAERPPGAVHLVAVTKNHGIEDILPLLEAGHRTFGENRVQEAAEKWPGLRAQYSDIRLHLIGHLQTNKAKDAVALFDVIETVDSERLAEALSREMQKQNRFLPCLIQVNTGEEEQKDGVAPKDLEPLAAFCKTGAGIDIRGLMCIPPAADIPDLHFALLGKLARRLSLPCLSMGMSGDFEAAIRHGSSQIRIGSALFQRAQ